MKVLYGIQGTGNGHLARARALVPELRKAGIEPDFVFSGRDRDDFFNMEVFSEDFKVFKGLSLITERGKLKTFDTITKNSLITFIKDVRTLDLSDYDLVLCDFEPVTAWAAKLAGKPCLGISHQCAFDYPVPKVRGYLGAKLLMKIFAPAQHKIGLHWHHFNQAILPPLIEPQQPKPAIKHKILVYMGFEAVEDIITFLKPFDSYTFRVYAKIDEPRTVGHIQLEPLSHKKFHNDLENCAGVISNCGFELASECLHLGKKLLAKPLEGQYEQLSNALALERLQYGTVINNFDHHALEEWLRLPDFEPFDYPNVGEALANWIVQGDFSNTDNLVQELWMNINQKTEFTDSFINKVTNADTVDNLQTQA